MDAIVLQCPKCGQPMERLSQPEADVHRCTNCRGLWFGMRGDELLKERAEAIDIGDAATGARYNAVDPTSPARSAGHSGGWCGWSIRSSRTSGSRAA